MNRMSLDDVLNESKINIRLAEKRAREFRVLADNADDNVTLGFALINYSVYSDLADRWRAVRDVIEKDNK